MKVRGLACLWVGLVAFLGWMDGWEDKDGVQGGVGGWICVYVYMGWIVVLILAQTDEKLYIYDWAR